LENLKTDIPTANATEIQIGYRVHNEPYYTFNRGDADSTNAVVWRVRIDGLGQGLHYDFTAKTLNIYGLESDVGNPTILDWTAPSDSAAPATPANLTIVVGTGKVISTDWDDNTESDLSEYRVYRKTGATQPATPDQGDSTSIIAEVRASRFVDIDVETDGTKYWYWVSALDTSENESALVGPVSGTPEGIAEDNTPPVQITDFHVDSTGTYQSSNGVTYAYIDFGWTNPALHFAFTRLLYKRDKQGKFEHLRRKRCVQNKSKLRLLFLSVLQGRKTFRPCFSQQFCIPPGNAVFFILFNIADNLCGVSYFIYIYL